MTLGERIAYLRKEKNLSQEGLGDLVGVSRQAVSKWEADRALPDVHNCVAMSQALGVTLAELLELEEGKLLETDLVKQEEGEISKEEVEYADQDKVSGSRKNENIDSMELTPSQLLVVERMIGTYEKAQKKLRRRWRWPIILVGCVLAVGIAWLWQWLTDMNRTIDYLHGEVAGLQGELIAEIAGISEQVQAGLREENSLVTDYEIQVVQADLKKDTITYEVSVNLKEGHVNTKQKIMARYGDESQMVEMRSTGGLGFVGQITCPILDGTVIYLVIEEDGFGKTRSQRLEEWMPEEQYDIFVDGWTRWASFEKTGLVDGAEEVLDLYVTCCGGPGLSEPIRLTAAEIALMRGQEEIKKQSIDLSQVDYNEDSEDWYLHCTEEVSLTADMAMVGDYLAFELRVWDNYDRYYSRVLSQYQVQQGGKVSSAFYEVYEVTE